MCEEKVSISAERSIYTFNYLRHAASLALGQAKDTKGGCNAYCMSSIILSAFSIEAYLNHIGEELLPYWDDDIKKGFSILNKLKIVCHHVGLQPDFSRHPFQSFSDIIKFRNQLAHGTTEYLTDNRKQTIRNGEDIEYPKTWWEEHSNLMFAKQWFKDTGVMINNINEAAGEHKLPIGLLSEYGASDQLIK